MTDDSGFEATRTSQTHSRLLRQGDMLTDRYKIEDVIGVGAMGTVYRAYDTRLDLVVALKILHASVASDSNSIKRFEAELKLARQISHPNVVRIHDIGEHGSLSFLSMDLIPGRPLDDILRDEGNLDPERAITIAAGIARGLDAAHKKQVVHRDLKPGNILVDDNDNAVITDFGVARSVASARLTQTGYFVGTPDYLAPEQARGDDTDGRADIYAVGLILYEMLHGQSPFQGQSLEELVAQRSLGRQPNLTRSGFVAPQFLRDVIRKCLQKSPGDRYQNARDLVNDLERKSSPGKARNRLVVGLTAVTLLLAGVLVFISFTPRDAYDEPQDMVAVATTAETTIAILPFHQEPPDPALSWVANAAHQALAIELDAISTLSVVDMQRVADTLAGLRIKSGTPEPIIAQQLSSLFSADWLITATLINMGERIIVRTDIIPAAASGEKANSVETTVDLSKVNEIGVHISNAISKALSLPAPDMKRLRLSSNMDALRAYAVGVEALNKGNSLEAIPALERGTEIDAGFAEAWLQLATAYEQSGRENDAVLAVESAIASSGSDQRLMGLARVKQAALSGDLELAQSVLERELKSRPSDSVTQFMLAELNGDQGHYEVALDLLQNIVASDTSHPRAWYLLGKFSIQNGDSQNALTSFLPTALQIQEELTNPQGQADVLNAMGIAYHRVGQLKEAGESYAKAAEIRQSIGDLRGFGSSLANVARLELQVGNFEEARASLDRAIEIRSKLQDMPGLAGLYNIYGVLEEEVGDYSTALQRYRQALQIREDRDDQYALGNSYNNVGFSYFMLGEYDNANVYWERAIEQSIKTSNPDNAMQARQGLGQLRLAQGDWNEASELFLQSLETSRKLGFPDAEAVALGNLGRVAHHTGRYQAAIDSYTESLDILQSLNDPRGLIEYLIWRAETWLNAGALERSRKDIDEALSLLADQSRSEQLANAHALKAVLLELSGDTEGAEQGFAEALSAASETGNDTPMLYLAVHQRMYQAKPPANITEIVETARGIGNASLYMQAMMIKARFEFEAGNMKEAAVTASELTLFLKNHSPFFQAWKIHALASRIFAANNDATRSEKERQAFIKECERLLSEAPPDTRESLAMLFSETGVSRE